MQLNYGDKHLGVLIVYMVELHPTIKIGLSLFIYLFIHSFIHSSNRIQIIIMIIPQTKVTITN